MKTFKEKHFTHVEYSVGIEFETKHKTIRIGKFKRMPSLKMVRFKDKIFWRRKIYNDYNELVEYQIRILHFAFAWKKK